MKSSQVIDLSKAGKGNFIRRWSKLREALWLIVEFLLITNPLQVSSRVRVNTLRLFGAKIGGNVIMRQRIRIRYPWNLEVGKNCWIGEGVWVINKEKVKIGDNTVISQESFITTGSHDIYKTMDIKVKPIVIESGVWVTSRCIILQGVTLGQNVVVSPGSVVNQSLKNNGIYAGNPAKFIKARFEK